MNVFEQENNLGSQINPESPIIPDSRINIDSQINSPIQPTFNIPRTRPTLNIQLTQPTDSELLTRPTDFELLTRPTDFLEKNEKDHEPEVNPDPEPSSSDSSDTSSSDSRVKKKKIKKKKKRRKHRKDESSDPSSSDNSDSSDDSYYRRKQCKKKKHRKKNSIKQCATLTEKLLTTAYKSKIIRFKMDEDPLHHRIYFLTFIDSLAMIFSQCRETCEVLLVGPGEQDRKSVVEGHREALHKFLCTLKISSQAILQM